MQNLKNSRFSKCVNYQTAKQKKSKMEIESFELFKITKFKHSKQSNSKILTL